LSEQNIIDHIQNTLDALRDRGEYPENPWIILHQNDWNELARELREMDQIAISGSSNLDNNPPILLNLPLWITTRFASNRVEVLSEEALQEILPDEWKLYGGEPYYSSIPK
jgi:hypothetical protein